MEHYSKNQQTGSATTAGGGNASSGTVSAWGDQADSVLEPVRLTSDFVFKYVFGSETSGGILRSFLTAVQTDSGLPAVAEVEIRNPFNLADSSEGKTSVVDVRARDVEGTIYTIEVQALPEVAFRERAHSTFHLAERETGTPILTPHLAIHFLELPKLHGKDAAPGAAETDNGNGGGRQAALSTPLGRWLYYIDERGDSKAMEDDILLQILKEDPDIEDAEERYRQFVADDELRERYQDRIKAERDRRSQIIFARNEGREEGREQGQTEARLDVARRMKAKGVPVDEIVDVTGLSAEEVAGKA